MSRSLLAVASLVLAFSVSAAPEKPTPVTTDRTALLIGNNRYATAALENAINDAEDLSRKLRELGFTTTVVSDADIRSMTRAVQNWVESIPAGAVALFYYSGHGFQLDGENYLVPIGFEAADEVDAQYSAFSAEKLLGKLERSPSRLNIIILDACRDNPFRGIRGSSKGLGLMQGGDESLIAYATSPGNTASDNPRGRNGLYTHYLLKALDPPGLSIEQVFKVAGRGVGEVSGGRQKPWWSSNVTEEFVFRSEEKLVPLVVTSFGPGGGIDREAALRLPLKLRDGDVVRGHAELRSGADDTLTLRRESVARVANTGDGLVEIELVTGAVSGQIGSRTSIRTPAGTISGTGRRRAHVEAEVLDDSEARFSVGPGSASIRHTLYSVELRPRQTLHVSLLEARRTGFAFSTDRGSGESVALLATISDLLQIELRIPPSTSGEVELVKEGSKTKISSDLGSSVAGKIGIWTLVGDKYMASGALGPGTFALIDNSTGPKPGEGKVEFDWAEAAKPPRGMVLIPAGEGVPAFFIQRTEVTVEEFQKFKKSYTPAFPGSALPAHGVSHEDALAYADWASLQLPTRAQWLRAAFGGEARKYPWGDEDPSPSRCNIDLGRPSMVGSHAGGASPFGVKNLAGNVSEWLRDGWVIGGSYNTFRLRKDVGGSTRDFLRDPRPGADLFAQFSGTLQVLYQSYRVSPEDGGLAEVGFRCVLEAPPEKPR